jgi:hypothetical protein
MGQAGVVLSFAAGLEERDMGCSQMRVKSAAEKRPGQAGP